MIIGLYQFQIAISLKDLPVCFKVSLQKRFRVSLYLKTHFKSGAISGYVCVLMKMIVIVKNLGIFSVIFQKYQTFTIYRCLVYNIDIKGQLRRISCKQYSRNFLIWIKCVLF